MMLPELLAPAGSFKALEAAIDAGADAVYFGGEAFGARAFAKNPIHPWPQGSRTRHKP